VRTQYSAVLLLAAALGCDGAPPQPPDAPPAAARRLFDPATAGAITGHVRWVGEPPSVPPLIQRPNLMGPVGNKETRAWPNPNAPAIDTKTHGVRGAVVSLRGVDPGRARPWDLPPVRVVQQGQQFHVRQGDGDGQVGFVRRGDAVEMVSADPVFHSLHAGGAAFFTLAFPDDDRPRTRHLADRGVVELTSAAGYFWMRGYLFVDDHPYYVRTDAEGQFRLTGVPPGHYEAVCWLPDWREERHERDPETSLVFRLFFRPPLKAVRPIEVPPKGSAMLEFELSAPGMTAGDTHN
jgi:hypothetical protein